MPRSWNEQAEWLETDGLGGYASGTVGGYRTRRYHGLLTVAQRPPVDRIVLVNGFDAFVDAPDARWPISTQAYHPDFLSPLGHLALARFETTPWPRWRFSLGDSIQVDQEILAVHGTSLRIITWRLVEPADNVTLEVRPFLSGRSHHALHLENASLSFAADARVAAEGTVRWHPHESRPTIISRSNGVYHHDPHWYHNFACREERHRGFDAREDLASPGELTFDLSRGEAVWILAAEGHGDERLAEHEAAETLAETLRERERQRRIDLGDDLTRAADAYVVRRGAGRTVIAGYPWFEDWGRDTFIAMRGLCVATGRLDVARDVLLGWTPHVDRGMLPNRFPDRGETPDFNAVDASLWFVIAAHDWIEACGAAGVGVDTDDLRTLHAAITAILEGYDGGTRHGIRADDDGLLMAGEPGVQLTWMDAKIGDEVVTPRTGKPVEVQALWLNALAVAATFDPRWTTRLERGRRSFGERFWNEERGCLLDVVDVDGTAGAMDASIRPNQIFAVGGLPMTLLEGERARRVVDVVERDLWTPLGLRTLAPGEPTYVGRYQGDPATRDRAYHQGTAWPWLAGPFIEGWVRVRGSTPAVREEATRRFVAPLLQRLGQPGLGHLAEIADGEPPHTPRGCPFQAWSLGELIRVRRGVLAPDGAGCRTAVTA